MQEKPIFPKLGFIANFLYYYCSVEAPHSLHLLLECLCKIEEDTLDTEIKQNHRSRAFLSLEGTSEYQLVPIPCSKQGQLEQVAQGHVHSSLEYVHRRRLYNCSGQAVPTLTHHHSKKKNTYGQDPSDPSLSWIIPALSAFIIWETLPSLNNLYYFALHSCFRKSMSFL